MTLLWFIGTPSLVLPRKEHPITPIAMATAMPEDLIADSEDGVVMTTADISRARVRRESESTEEQGAIDKLHQEIARGEIAIPLRCLERARAFPWII